MSLQVIYSDVQTLVTKDVTRLTVCHKGSTLGVTGTVNGFLHDVISFVPGFLHTRLDRLDAGARVNAYSHSNNTYGGSAVDVWTGVAALDTGSALDVRILLGGVPGAPSYQGSAVCCQETTTDYHLEEFQPGVATFTDAGISWLSFHIAAKRPYVECDNLSSHHLFLSRISGHKYLAAAAFQTTATQTGTGTISSYSGNNRGGCRWTEFQVRNSGGSTLATFHASDHPDGAIWYGDRYVYDAGGALAVGTGGVIAVNGAATLGLIESGKIVETDFTTSPTIPVGYHTSGPVDLQNNRLEMGAGARILYTLAGNFPECVSEGVIRVPGTGAAEGGAIIGTGAPDVRAAIRVSFDDPAGTTFTSQGVGDGNDLANFYQERAWTGVWPTGADVMTIEQIQIGSGAGQACSKEVELVIGNVCCAQTIVPPQIGLPPVSVDCLLTASAKVYAVNDCASGGGIGIAVSGTVKKGPTCPDIDTSSAWAFEAMYFEEYDPVNFPGEFALIRTDRPAGNLPPITGAPAGDPFGWAVLITNEDPLGINPTPGTSRGSDGGSPQTREAKRWYVRVILRNLFNPGQSGSIDTAPTSSVVAYDWCP